MSRHRKVRSLISEDYELDSHFMEENFSSDDDGDDISQNFTKNALFEPSISKQSSIKNIAPEFDILDVKQNSDNIQWTIDNSGNSKMSNNSISNNQNNINSDKNMKQINKNDTKKVDSKENLNLIVIGHVDAGKSTLVGHLLYKLGYVNQKTMHKYEHETKKMGKQSVMYAWILDEIEEERNRGITIDVATAKFETKNKIITLLDAPGHQDFIPNMITGATQADIALLVVDATCGEFETGLDNGGQTREHILLVRSLGVSQLIVVVNKMDNISWSEDRFLEVCQKLKIFLHQAGFKDSDIFCIPCSGLKGDNLIEKYEGNEKKWYKDCTLIEAIDRTKTPERLIKKAFRMCVNDICRSAGATTYISGRVETGCLSIGNKVCIQPRGDTAVVKGLIVNDDNQNTVNAGSFVNISLGNVTIENVTVGSVLCNIENPIPVATKFQARIVIFDVVVPITKGYTVMLHLHSIVDEVVIKKLNALLHKAGGEIVKKNPRCLFKNSAAVVTIETSRPICIELYKDFREFGRFILRDNNVTIAAGLIIKI